MHKLAIAACALAMLSVPAMAQDAEHEFPMTMSDFMMAYPDATPETFDLVDADGDGEISEDEHTAATEAGLIDDEA